MPHVNSTLHTELVAFLADHLGRPESGDVGALLGQAALLSDVDAGDADLAPETWHEAFNVALCAAAAPQRLPHVA